jgi:hypothetical protein
VATQVSEEDFFAPFAEWIKNELEECTKAIPLGRNKFKDKWGTPDVLGIRKSKAGDILPSVVTSKPAICGQGKTGHGKCPELRCCTLSFAFRASLISEISRWRPTFSSKLEKNLF